jgi:hypothetical protein
MLETCIACTVQLETRALPDMFPIRKEPLGTRIFRVIPQARILAYLYI